MVNVKLRRLGNSTGLPLHAEVLKEAGFSKDQEVTLFVSKGLVSITPAETTTAKALLSLDKCIARYGKAMERLAR